MSTIIEDKLLIRIKDASRLCQDKTTYKDLFFIDERYQKEINHLSKQYPNVVYVMHSNIENASKVFISLVNESLIINEDLSDYEDCISLVRVDYNNKFNTLTHKDILGILMANKIDPNYIGDIVSYNDNLYFEIKSNLYDYLLQHITHIGKTKVTFKLSNDKIEKIQNYQSKSVTVKSNRLDVIVKTITNKSREDAKAYILEDNVKVNQEVTTNISKEIKDNDIISIRKYGRYKINYSSEVLTKKGNILLTYHKYI